MVVDDGSTDGTPEKINTAFPQVTILQGDGNYYWTKCVNTALLQIQNEMKTTDFVLHINNDTEFENTYVEDLLNFHKKYPNSIVGSLSYDPDSKMVSHLGVFYNPWVPIVKKNFSEEEIDKNRLADKDYLKFLVLFDES